MGNSTARGLATAALAAMASLGCPSESGSGAADDAGAASDDRAIAERLLSLSAALPLRSEVVAITDRLSIAGSKHEDASHAAALKTLAAALRERVWRFDRRDTDAREALELYQQVVEALPATAVACTADLARARIASELSRDAAAAYRELYLALERQASSDVDDEVHAACMAKLRAMLERAEAFRPTGSAWQALQREAAQAAPVASASAAPSSSGSAASSLPPPGEGEIVVAPPDAMVTPGKKRLTKVQTYGGSQGGGRVVLYLDKPAQYDTGDLEPDPAAGRPHRVYIDLKEVRYKGLDDDLKVEGLIKGVRLGKRNFGTRVVLDLAEDAARRVFYLPEPYRVVIDVSTRKASEAAAVPSGKRAVRRVALDPGHGGWDAGAVGPTGLREKDVALDVAHRAAPALASELGIETILTRDTDVFIELDERTARANAFQSDLFISIHCNATENGQASGLEVYILDPTRDQDAAAMRAVARENHGRGHALDPALLDAQLINIAAGLGMARSTEGSRVFADLLRKATLGSVTERFPHTTDHGTKTAGFFVLVGAEMPAVLYETAFISNPDDETRLGTADYRQKLADAIVNGVRAYRDGLR